MPFAVSICAGVRRTREWFVRRKPRPPTHPEVCDMATTNRNMITAVFRDRFNAHSAYSWLTSHGYNSSDINLLMAESTKAKYYSNPDESPIAAGTHTAEGMATGGAVGTAL